MKTRNYLLYKPFHNEKRLEIRQFNTFEEVTAAAAHMLDQFRYWGGGAVPISANADRWTAAGKYKDTLYYIEYPARLYMDYARENGNKCGYLQDQERRENNDK